MHKLLKIFGSSVCAFGVCAVVGMAYAADPARGNTAHTGRNTANGATAARMPTMPTLPINALGNITQNLNNNGGVVGVPIVPVQPNNPDNPNPNPNPDPDPEPTPDCPDGGVRDTDYTIEQCMNDLLTCINNGALPNGLNDMFNADVRNAVVNGMGLCAAQVDRCRTVRKDCRYVYNASSNVWIDFNSRRVQPEYYAFVLRRTGLTPNQAENTCWLLDKNTYGASFSAVANSGATTSEYNRTVGAYNGQQNNSLTKANPMGVTVNDGNPGVDGQRGHYARWDAANADCLLRVAAYNNDKLIQNSWLFGAAGDDTPAEVWKSAGSTFTCNKDLFDFSLLNNTHTAAVVGIGGGTLLGAGIGAIAGHGARAFDCNNEKHREMLAKQLSGKFDIVSDYFINQSNRINHADGITADACTEIVNLFDRYNNVKDAANGCAKNYSVDWLSAEIKTKVTCSDGNGNQKDCTQYNQLVDVVVRVGEEFVKLVQIENTAENAPLNWEWFAQQQMLENQELQAAIKKAQAGCLFTPLNQAIASGSGIYCSANADCRNATDIKKDLDSLAKVFNKDMADLINNGEKGNRLKTTAIGAGIGAGTGGLATAITAFVEKNNINCRVGDGLNRIGYKKSHTIDTLKDIYVKWNLHLPDTIAPTAEVTDCASWQYACQTLSDLNQCAAAQINYRAPNSNSVTLIYTACTASGSTCVANDSLSEYAAVCATNP
ncbi:MAG: hypothetical protein IJ560_03370 [Alphaproteobacteria bacterium]|nr:hypothetical protein [Alphaproteobacteria bacterium]